MSQNIDFLNENNLQVIGVSKLRDRKSAPKFVAKNGYKFKFFTGTKELHRELMRIDAIPLVMIFDSEGKILDEEFGYQNLEDIKLMLEN